MKDFDAILDKLLTDDKYRANMKKAVFESAMTYDDFIYFYPVSKLDETLTCQLLPLEFFMDCKNKGFSNDYIDDNLAHLIEKYYIDNKYIVICNGKR